MTPVKEKTLGPDGAAVALEEESAGRTSAEDGTREKDSPAEAEAVQTTAQAIGDDQASSAEASPAEHTPADSVKKAEFQEVSQTPVKDKTANLSLPGSLTTWATRTESEATAGLLAREPRVSRSIDPVPKSQR